MPKREKREKVARFLMAVALSLWIPFLLIRKIGRKIKYKGIKESK